MAIDEDAELEKQGAAEALEFAERVVRLAIAESSGPAVAAVGLIAALVRVVVTMARSRNQDLDEVRAGLLDEVGQLFDRQRRA